MDLRTDDICSIQPDLATAASFFPNGFQINTCPFYSVCKSPTRYVHPKSALVLDVSYCEYSPIFLGVMGALFLLLLIGALVVYIKVIRPHSRQTEATEDSFDNQDDYRGSGSVGGSRHPFSFARH